MKKIVKGIEWFLDARNATDVKVHIYDPGCIGAKLVPFTKQIRVIFQLGKKRYRWEYIFDDQLFTKANILYHFKKDFHKKKDLPK